MTTTLLLGSLIAGLCLALAVEVGYRQGRQRRRVLCSQLRLSEARRSLVRLAEQHPQLLKMDRFHRLYALLTDADRCAPSMTDLASLAQELAQELGQELGADGHHPDPASSLANGALQRWMQALAHDHRPQAKPVRHGSAAAGEPRVAVSLPHR